MSEPTDHLNHSTWDSKYHVVFTPKYRKKLLYGHLRGELREVLHRLSRQKECEIVEGRLSRASSVQTSARNYTGDEGRSFGFGCQGSIPSHRKLLSLRAMVVSVAETSGRRSRQARLREASASEPSLKCRKRFR